MEKTKYYYRTCFSPDTMREAHDTFLSLIAGDVGDGPQSLEVTTGDSTWSFDSREEFFAACRGSDSLYFDHIVRPARMVVRQATERTFVSVRFPDRSSIETVLNVFERNADSSLISSTPDPITVFIGHGRDPQWRDLKDHLHHQHGLEVVAYEIGPRAGLSVKEVLEGMLTDSSFALLVLTGEDEHTDGSLHARQNVVHELGLFQGQLGFTRAIALLEAGVDEFSNILGVNQIRFSKGGIRETYGDILATLRREFDSER